VRTGNAAWKRQGSGQVNGNKPTTRAQRNQWGPIPKANGAEEC
jgi:hypothetical protein